MMIAEANSNQIVERIENQDLPIKYYVFRMWKFAGHMLAKASLAVKPSWLT